MTGRDDVKLLLSDLACVSRALGEIATAWRRAGPDRPHLPLTLPVQLQSSVTQLAAAVRAHTDQGPAQQADPAPCLAEQLSGLRRRIDAARAITCGRGRFQVGDGGLWETANAALARAAARVHRAGSASA
jgi:hypothetical protein